MENGMSETMRIYRALGNRPWKIPRQQGRTMMEYRDVQCRCCSILVRQYHWESTRTYTGFPFNRSRPCNNVRQGEWDNIFSECVLSKPTDFFCFLPCTNFLRVWYYCRTSKFLCIVWIALAKQGYSDWANRIGPRCNETEPIKRQTKFRVMPIVRCESEKGLPSEQVFRWHKHTRQLQLQHILQGINMVHMNIDFFLKTVALKELVGLENKRNR